MARSDYTPPTFVDVPNPASPPGGAVPLDATRLNAMAQAIANSVAATDVARVVTPEKFGAVGDGVTNDSAAILNAVAALPAGPGALYLSPGKTYRFTHLAITRDDLTIYSDGTATLYCDLTGSPDTDNGLMVWGNNLAIRSIKVKGALADAAVVSAGYNYSILARFGSPSGSFKSGLVVENCEFRNGIAGGVSAFSTSNVVIRNNRVIHCGGNGIAAENCQRNVLIDGNRVYDTGDDMIVIIADQTVPTGTINVQIVNNTVERSGAKGIGTTGVDRCVIANNHVTNTYASGILSFADPGYPNLGASHRTSVVGNTVADAGWAFGVGYYRSTAQGSAAGIEMTAVPECTVANNLVIHPNQRGIQLDKVATGKIIGNTVRDAGSTGINVGNPSEADFLDCTDITVTGNSTLRTVGGITLGSITNVVCSNNLIRSFRNGGTGSWRGIFYGYLKNGYITTNAITNDDGGDANILEYPSGSSTGLTVS